MLQRRRAAQPDGMDRARGNYVLLAALAIAVVSAVPAHPRSHKLGRHDVVALGEAGWANSSESDPPEPNPCQMDNPADCDAVPCCTWCGSKWGSGWCSAVNATKSLLTALFQRCSCRTRDHTCPCRCPSIDSILVSRFYLLSWWLG